MVRRGPSHDAAWVFCGLGLQGSARSGLKGSDIAKNRRLLESKHAPNLRESQIEFRGP